MTPRWFWHRRTTPERFAAEGGDAEPDVPAAAEEHGGDAPQPGDELRKAIAEMGPPRRDTEPMTGDAAESPSAVEQSPLVRMANAIIVQAVRAGASDIFLEPNSRNLSVRFRIDGALRMAFEGTVPKPVEAPLIGRFKVMAGMDIARAPQTSGIPLRFDGRSYELRVSSLPSLRGEALTIHITAHARVTKGLRALGLPPSVAAQLEDWALRPSGLVVVGGPADSGKTTTLFSLLYKLNSVRKKIVTLEEPVEYPLDGVTQIEVGGGGYGGGVSLATGWRAALRHNPGVVVLGEVGDAEAGRIAVEAARLGHLTLCTLNAVDAAGAVERLARLSGDGGGLAQALTGVCVQRLLPRLCDTCKEAYAAPACETLPPDAPWLDGEKEVTLFRPVGCDACGGAGSRGRVPVFDLTNIDATVRALIGRAAPRSDLVEGLRDDPARPAFHDQIRKLVREGLVSLDEARRVLPNGF